MELPYIEPFKIKMVENIYKSSREERIKWIKSASYNMFNLRSDQVIIDLLTDSGTGAMSDMQWSALMRGDESYAGSASFFRMKDAIKDITGFDYCLPVHQGRAAENVLFSALVKEGDVVPGNSHFDTTKGHIEFRKAKAIDCPVNEASDISSLHPFKGNADISKLGQVLSSTPPERVPCIIMTITNNSTGGQPVSMGNLKEVRRLADHYGIKVFFDSARFAENAYFIKTREDGYAGKDIREIVREMFSYADGMTMSAKKDAIVNMGGFIALKEKALYKRTSVYNIIYEGFTTYGGMSGRDMEALAKGLYEGTEFEWLESRISQVAYLGSRLREAGVPVLQPFGGHAVFIDACVFFPEIPREEFPAQTLVAELYIEGGIRSSEIGALMADRDPVTRENRYPARQFVRLAIPRRVYTAAHMDYVAAAVVSVYERRDTVKRGLIILKEGPILRHFTAELERL